MCEEYCGTDNVTLQECLTNADQAAAADAMALMSGQSPEPVRVVQMPQCAPLLADVPPESAFEARARVELPESIERRSEPLQDLIDTVVHRVTRQTGLRTYTNHQGAEVTVQRNNVPVLTGTPVEKLLRLSEELLECEHPDVDTQWYHKRLQEIKAELAEAGYGQEA
jgi:hypothetical protein